MMSRYPKTNPISKITICRLIAIVVLFSLIYLFYVYSSEPEVDYCFKHDETRASDLEDILLADHRPTLGRSIFFHETTCHKDFHWTNKIARDPITADYKSFGISARQACAIESAAFHNPNRDVFVLFTSNIALENVASRPVLHALLSYSNLFLRKANLFTYTEDTPVQDWIKQRDLFKSKYITAHMADFLRLITLWRYGGIYFDLDCILLQSFEQVPQNFIGAESNDLFANGVMGFSAAGIGKNITEQCLMKFQKDFNGQGWAANGPILITNILLNFCGVNSVKALLKSDCHGFKAFGKEAFYEIYYPEWSRIFAPAYRNDVLKRTNNSYLVHLWNKLSYQTNYKIGTGAAFEDIIQDNCPRVFTVAKDVGFI